MEGQRRVKDLADLKSICKGLPDGRGEFAILLNGGFRSSKSITFNDPEWTIYNSIDDSWQEFRTDRGMLRRTNIGKALERKALIWDGY